MEGRLKISPFSEFWAWSNSLLGYGVPQSVEHLFACRAEIHPKNMLIKLSPVVQACHPS